MTTKLYYVVSDPTELDLQTKHDDPRARDACTNPTAARAAATALGRDFGRILATRAVEQLPAWIETIDGEPRPGPDNGSTDNPLTVRTLWIRKGGREQVAVTVITDPPLPWTRDDAIGQLVPVDVPGSVLHERLLARYQPHPRLAATCNKDTGSDIRERMLQQKAQGGDAWYLSNTDDRVYVRSVDEDTWTGRDQNASYTPSSISGVIIAGRDEVAALEGETTQAVLAYAERVIGWATGAGHRAEHKVLHACAECEGAHWATAERAETRYTLKAAHEDAARLRRASGGEWRLTA